MLDDMNSGKWAHNQVVPPGDRAISRRDYFAAMAMQSWLRIFADADQCKTEAGGLHDSIALVSVSMADALITELDKEKT